MSDLNNCDSCGAIERVIDLFWDIDNPENDSEAIILDEMTARSYCAICEKCANNLMAIYLERA